MSPEYELDAGGEHEGDGAAAGEHEDQGEEGEQPHQEQVAGHSRGLTQYYYGGVAVDEMIIRIRMLLYYHDQEPSGSVV